MSTGEQTVAALREALKVSPDDSGVKLSMAGAYHQPGESDEPREGDGRIALPREGRPQDFTMNLERPRIAFKDVGGMENLKEEIRMKIIHPLEHPALRAVARSDGPRRDSPRDAGGPYVQDGFHARSDIIIRRAE
ncbi:MAG: hypothetical protein HZA50_07680 [Planctomycetes bacterium]|nr:hypothetical protein [Planctomycetota bacterium]